MSNVFLNSHSASSSEASTRRRTNPTATPMRTSPFIIAAILNISAAALQVEERAPPPLPLPLDEDFKELKTMANDWLVHIGRHTEATLVWAFSPPNEFNPPIWTTRVFLLQRELRPQPEVAAAVNVAGESAADVIAIPARPTISIKKTSYKCCRKESWLAEIDGLVELSN